jgi:hypothetical protein
MINADSAPRGIDPAHPLTSKIINHQLILTRYRHSGTPAAFHQIFKKAVAPTPSCAICLSEPDGPSRFETGFRTLFHQFGISPGSLASRNC